MDAVGSRYWRTRNAAIAAARRNSASLWFAGAPADLAGFVWQDSAGTIAATGTDLIGRLTDRAGSNAATQATTGSRPTLELQANGYFGMRFDGLDDFLTNALPLSNVANHTLIVAGRVNSTSVARTLSTGGAPTTASVQRVAQIRLSQADGFAQGVYATDAPIVSQINGSVNLLNTAFVGEIVAVSGSATLYVNGAIVGSTAINAGATTTSIGVTGGNKTTGVIEPMSGLIYLECRCASAMPDADRIAIGRFAALLSAAPYA